MGHLHQSGTECLVVDDAHDLSMPHPMFLKEVTDQGLPGTPLQYMPPGSVGKTTRATFEQLSKRGQEWGDWKGQEEIAHAITELRQTLKQTL